jgi:S1-C subfamily serine protease
MKEVFKWFLCLMLVAANFACDRQGVDYIGEELNEVYNEIAEGEACEVFDLANHDYVYSVNSWKKSREAAVRVEVDAGFGLVGGSGTYFKIGKDTVVVTAAHLYTFSPGLVFQDEAIITTPHEKVVGTLVYIDRYVDIAVIKVPTLDSRNAPKFRRAKKLEVGTDVVYSGFPGANNLLTFGGVLIGEGYGTDVAMQSVAWPGSSGSGVFDTEGNFVGVVSAIMVGHGIEGRQLIESIVYVAPSNLIDSRQLKANLDKHGRTRHEGF